MLIILVNEVVKQHMLFKEFQLPVSHLNKICINLYMLILSQVTTMNRILNTNSVLEMNF